MYEPREVAEPTHQGTGSVTPTGMDEKEFDAPSENDFNPIEIIGELLSATIIRERREGW
jgi:hypothetical protein